MNGCTKCVSGRHPCSDHCVRCTPTLACALHCLDCLHGRQVCLKHTSCHVCFQGQSRCGLHKLGRPGMSPNKKHLEEMVAAAYEGAIGYDETTRFYHDDYQQFSSGPLYQQGLDPRYDYQIPSHHFPGQQQPSHEYLGFFQQHHINYSHHQGQDYQYGPPFFPQQFSALQQPQSVQHFVPPFQHHIQNPQHPHISTQYHQSHDFQYGAQFPAQQFFCQGQQQFSQPLPPSFEQSGLGQLQQPGYLEHAPQLSHCVEVERQGNGTISNDKHNQKYTEFQRSAESRSTSSEMQSVIHDNCKGLSHADFGKEIKTTRLDSSSSDAISSSSSNNESAVEQNRDSNSIHHKD